MSNRDVEKQESKEQVRQASTDKHAEDRLVAIGQNIQLTRIAKGKSQTYVAVQVGISPSKLSRIESGTVSFTVKDLILICEALNIEVSDVMDENIEDISIAEMAHRRRVKEFDREEYKKIVKRIVRNK